MIKLYKAFFFSLLFFLAGCSRTDCHQLPKNYSSYNEAVNTIKAAHFILEESVNTSKSSWVRGAKYYSCDGVTGFFILQTDDQDYIYSGVPLENWKEFKNSNSFGRYYNENIKHKYSFNLIQ